MRPSRLSPLAPGGWGLDGYELANPWGSWRIKLASWMVCHDSKHDRCSINKCNRLNIYHDLSPEKHNWRVVKSSEFGYILLSVPHVDVDGHGCEMTLRDLTFTCAS